MPRMCAIATMRDNPDVAVIVLETVPDQYNVVANGNLDKDDEYDIPVLSGVNFAEAYKKFLSLI